jgi:hypothetical protein
MHQIENKGKHLSALVQLLIVSVVTVLPGRIAAFQNLPLAPVTAPGTSTVQSSTFDAALPFSTTPSGGARTWQLADNVAAAPGAGSSGGKPIRSDGVRRITLEQVKQSVDPVASPPARLGQLSIEAAKQHRLGVQADYFPKFGATLANLHYTQFLGEVEAVRRPFLGLTKEVPIPLFNQNMTIAALTFTQPITPLFTVRQG